MAITVRNIWWQFSKNEPFLIRGADFNLNKGDCSVLFGPNGCGKTTFSKILLGIYRPDRGQVTIDGQDITDLTLGEVGQKIGYVFQNPHRQIFNPTVEKEIAFGLHYRQLPAAEITERVERLLVYFDLEPLRHQFPYTLSQGEKQRLALASVLALNPPYFILDEPTTGLDGRRKEQLAKYLRHLQQEGRGVLIISHDRKFATNIATSIWAMTAGTFTRQEVAEIV